MSVNQTIEELRLERLHAQRRLDKFLAKCDKHGIDMRKEFPDMVALFEGIIYRTNKMIDELVAERGYS